MACQCHAGRLPEPDSLDDAFARVQKYHMNNIPHFPAVEVKQNALKSQIHRDSAQLIADNDFVENGNGNDSERAAKRYVGTRNSCRLSLIRPMKTKSAA